MRTALVAPVFLLLLSLPVWLAPSHATESVMQHVVDSYFIVFLNTLGERFGCFM